MERDCSLARLGLEPPDRWLVGRAETYRRPIRDERGSIEMKQSLWILILGAIAVGGTTLIRAERMGLTESPSSRTSEQGKTATLAGGCFWCME